MEPTFSIVIPAKNGMPYLGFALKSALEDKDQRIEIILSIDGKDPESIRYLNSLDDPRLIVIEPPQGLSMSEHWDFAQRAAKGKWQMFLGQDDLLMTNYFKALSPLAQLASSIGIDVVLSRRAYIAWPPLGSLENAGLQYWHSKKLKTYSSEYFIRAGLFSRLSYHGGPQIYTSSIASKDLLDKIREQQNGRLILGHPQDAFLEASILSHTHNILVSGFPFSWVGTSTKSAGLAISRGANGDIEQRRLAEQYISSVADSELRFSSETQFNHGIDPLYFFDALKNINPQSLATLRGQNGFSRKLRRLEQSIQPTLSVHQTLDQNSRILTAISRLGKILVSADSAAARVPHQILKLCGKAGISILGFRRIESFDTLEAAWSYSRQFNARPHEEGQVNRILRGSTLRS